MTAREAISPIEKYDGGADTVSVDGGMHLLEVLPKLLESPSRRLGVTNGDGENGVIDQQSMLEAMGRLIVPRFDCSIVELECAASDYSASLIARAVEDSDVHLTDLLTSPGQDGKIHVTLRVRCDDPTSTVHCLERYGYEITAVYGHENALPAISAERLLALQSLLSI